MGDVQALPTTKGQPADTAPAVQADPAPVADVRPIDGAHCALCGGKLSARALRHHVVSPQSCGRKLTVCHVCHKAALGEGYRPAD
jgi:hypothetical protein